MGVNKIDYIDIDSDEGSNFLTMENWNADIVAFNTPQKENNQSELYASKNVKISYKMPLNFDAYLSTNATKQMDSSVSKKGQFSGYERPKIEPSRFDVTKTNDKGNLSKVYKKPE